ncbi:MAG: hypothetical protein NC299_03845 [Lachnospiraceae bacterium]|nr:hypothetical protein [Ruminococcus sp.]MCM1274479.1 hypothetical protein [Lachnospiraceae bacterium]
MKKFFTAALTVFLSVICGVLGNAAVCLVTVYLWGISAGFGVFGGAFAVCALAALLTAVGKRVRGLGVNRAAFLLCTQTPSLAILSAALVSTYNDMNSSGNDMFSGLGQGLARGFFQVELVMLIAVAAATVCAVIAALFGEKLKSLWNKPL